MNQPELILTDQPAGMDKTIIQSGLAEYIERNGWTRFGRIRPSPA